ncbi:B9 domain-containing protein 2 [Plasmodiophora brassicae]
MPEVHFIGSIVGASGFKGKAVFGKFAIESDNAQWKVIRGSVRGRTFSSIPDENTTYACWNHPVDVCFSCTGLLGWPKFFIELFFLDDDDRIDFAGYGFCYLPARLGRTTLTIATFRPRGSLTDDLSAKFVGGYPQYADKTVVMDGAERWRERTVSTGTVQLDINVVHKGFRDDMICTDGSPAVM